MFRRLVVAALSALLLALPAATQAQGSTQSPTIESDNPINDQGSSYHYRSDITAVVPSVPGVSLQVLEFADRLLLTNHSGQTVTVYGYQGEPYARVLANGTVEINTRSPAYYLNQNFYGDVTVPASASPSATPQWTVVDRTGQLEWHDHRIHWMSPVGASRGQGSGEADKDLRLAGADPGGHAQGSRGRRTLLDSRERHQGPRLAPSSRWW